MAQIGAVHSVGECITRHLTGALTLERATQGSLPEARRTLPVARFEQISGQRFTQTFNPEENLVTFYLYRMAVDRHLRASGDPKTPQDPKSRPLSLELHYLVTVWGEDAAAEQTLLSWTMLELHRVSLFDRAALRPAALWDAGETIQLQPSEMSHEDMMRIWAALRPGYRLSASYIARTVRLETGIRTAASPVVATMARFVPQAEDADA
ncbi:MAG: DUF4255 domain-containing protein [Rhizobiaceae bacterium]